MDYANRTQVEALLKNPRFLEALPKKIGIKELPEAEMTIRMGLPDTATHPPITLSFRFDNVALCSTFAKKHHTVKAKEFEQMIQGKKYLVKYRCFAISPFA